MSGWLALLSFCMRQTVKAISWVDNVAVGNRYGIGIVRDL